MDPTVIAIAVVAWLLLSGDSSKKAPAPSSPRMDGAALIARANSPRAASWATYLVSLGASPALSEALSRWIGLESGGNPLAVSRLGERGLLQAMQATAVGRGGFFSMPEWESLTNPATTAEEHARLAIKEYAALWARAAARITDPPGGDLDRVFYAKLYHQWPKDFWTVKMRGPALAMAGELARLWATSPNSMHRLRMAAVVAWNDPEPWSANV